MRFIIHILYVSFSLGITILSRSFYLFLDGESSGLSNHQKAKIEQNKQKALRLRQSRASKRAISSGKPKK